MPAELKPLHHRMETTTVDVTPDQIEAMTMADQIVVMNAGKVEQIGAPLALYDRPANVFVAGFIGSPAMNFLEGTLAGRAIRVGGVSLPIAGEGAPRETSAILGIRPEHIEITDDPTVPLEARVDLIEPMGVTTLVHASLAGSDLKILCLDRPRWAPDSSVRLRLPAAKLHLFDAATQRRFDFPLAP